MFRSVLRPSSGVSSRTLRNYYVSACLLRRISVCGGMLSVCVYLRCNCQCGVWMCTHPDTTPTGTSQVYTYRQHTATDWNATRQARWHTVIAQGTVIDSLMMVGGLTETGWVFKINFKYASQTFLMCVVLNVNCESVLINKCMSW